MSIWFLSILLVAVSCEKTMPSAAPEPDYEALDALTEGSNKFVVALYQALSKKGGNIIVSPASLQIVLALARCGAKGQTQKEIAAALGLPDNMDMLLRGHKSLIELLQLPVLSVANKIFLEKTFEVNADFKEIATKWFRSSPEGVNFMEDAEAARKHINLWVEDNTNKKIKDLLPEGVIDSMTRVVLTNAIHFKANWVHKFDELSTTDEPFYITPTETVQVKMMHIKKKFGHRYHEQLQANVVELPYEGREMRMIIILPDAIDGLKETERKLANINLAEEFSRLNEVTVNLSMPRFKIEETMDLGEILEQLGMPTMFTDQADFSAISETEPLKVSKVIQKAFIEVNEEGTEAAAATGAVLMMRCLSFDPEVHFNHPFLYAIIRDLGRGARGIVFVGSVNNPGQEISE